MGMRGHLKCSARAMRAQCNYLGVCSRNPYFVVLWASLLFRTPLANSHPLQSPPPPRETVTSMFSQAAAKPAPHAIASSSSASATHPVPVMETEHVQQFKVCYSRTQKFFTVALDPQ